MAAVPEGINLFFWESLFSARTAFILHALVVDLVAIAIVGYGVFYRRYRRSDLLLAILALNIGLFVVGVLIVNQTRMGVAFGFGLFAILSIIRLRSDPISPEESAYYFLALVLGLVNGMTFRDRWLIYILDGAVVGLMVLVDNKWVLPRAQRQMVTLDVVHPDEASLRADLERRLTCKVLHLVVKQVDYVREVTVVDVRLKPLKSFPGPDPLPVNAVSWGREADNARAADAS